jgi:hypothetical protein
MTIRITKLTVFNVVPSEDSCSVTIEYYDVTAPAVPLNKTEVNWGLLDFGASVDSWLTVNTYVLT